MRDPLHTHHHAQVENGVQKLVATGPFSVAVVAGAGGAGDGAGDSSNSSAAAAPAGGVRAAVGGLEWALGKHLPALKAAPAVYSFGREDTRSVYYCLILPAGAQKRARMMPLSLLPFTPAA